MTKLASFSRIALATLAMSAVLAEPASAQRWRRAPQSAATTTQVGQANSAGIAQDGQANNANASSTIQEGRGNAASVVQSGAGNTAGIRQFGRDNTGAITQAGSGNTACLIQAGRNLNGAVQQVGDNQSSGLLQTRWGSNEIPVAVCATAMTRGDVMAYAPERPENAARVRLRGRGWGEP